MKRKVLGKSWLQIKEEQSYKKLPPLRTGIKPADFYAKNIINACDQATVKRAKGEIK